MSKRKSLLTKSERRYAKVLAQFAPMLAEAAARRKLEKRLRKELRQRGAVVASRTREPNWPVAGYYYDSAGAAGGTGQVRKVGR
jgi:hypothetical protein